MDKRETLKAAAVMAAIIILSGLAYLAFDGRIWADIVLAVILVGWVGYGFYCVFKD